MGVPAGSTRDSTPIMIASHGGSARRSNCINPMYGGLSHIAQTGRSGGSRHQPISNGALGLKLSLWPVGAHRAESCPIDPSCFEAPQFVSDLHAGGSEGDPISMGAPVCGPSNRRKSFYQRASL